MKYGIILMIICAFAFNGFSQNDKPRTNTTAAQMEASSEIPKPINTWVTTNYPKNKVVRNSMDTKNMNSAHSVYLDNGVALQFNDRNEVTRIEGQSAIPNTIVPANINTYVSRADASRTIYTWEWIDTETQQITLDNGQKMRFSKTGEFIADK